MAIAGHKRIMVDIDTFFAPGMLYTALGRIQNISQLYIKTRTPERLSDMIRTNVKTLLETERIEEKAINRKEAKCQNKWLRPKRKHLKIASLNIRYGEWLFSCDRWS